MLNLKAGAGFDQLVVALFAAAVAAGFLHWFESWLAHDVAYRMLAELRLGLFKKLASLGPAYLLRRRSGDLVSMATHDVELVEYFVAHTLVPAAVGVLVPAGVLIALAFMSPWMALVLLPFLLVAAASPAMARKRVDRLGSEMRMSLGRLSAHVTDTVQGLSEVVAFQREDDRRKDLTVLSRSPARPGSPSSATSRASRTCWRQPRASAASQSRWSAPAWPRQARSRRAWFRWRP